MENVEEFKTVQGKPKQIVSGALFWILTVMYTIAYNSDLRAASILWYGVSIITIGVLAYIVSSKYMHKSVGVYAVWAVAFFGYSFVSGLWALEPGNIFDPSKTLFLIFAVNILLSFIIENKEDVKNILLANFLALVLYLVYIILKVDITQLGEDRLGIGVLGSLWNANDVGLKLCIGFALALYLGFERKEIALRLCFWIIGLLFAAISLYTGSRKVVLMLIGVMALFMFLYSKHKIAALIVVAVSVVVMYFAIMNIEPLYNVLGERIEDTLEGIFGEGTTEGSFNARAEMIKLGWNAFLERPIFGYGLNNFRTLYEQATGLSTYSHNNFIEILVNGGLVGFILYYFIYGYVFVKLFKPAFVKREPTAIILFAINLVLIGLQIAVISYQQTLFNCILMLAVMYVQMGEKTHENS